MADVEFGTEFPEFNLLALEEVIIDSKAVERVVVDENVIAKFPQDTHSITAIKHSPSMWTQTACISITLPDGTSKSYFLKVAAGALGLGMIEGEYESIAAIHAVKPGFCPKPRAWGTFKSNPDLHFLLSDFVEMDQEIPEKDIFTTMLADFHLASRALSPNGKFGFHCTTYNGNLAQDNTWTDTWEEYYKNNIIHMLQLEEEARGPSDELRELSRQLLERVIPRLLRPLETDPNTLKPCLIHGDLWYGNTAIDLDTGKPITFDAAAFWGHHEYEVRTMRPAGFGREYLNAYHEKFPPSEPIGDAEDRLALYALRSRIHDSALYPMNAGFRNLLIEQMRLLVEKYPDGYEGPKTDA
ncbi:Fructosamine kinase-domain-containing protein [Xylogone sp. PMI_703]|nr:Fructosamine kinase-domain-containing protein [Xylogone sp. PMI_703]